MPGLLRRGGSGVHVLAGHPVFPGRIRFQRPTVAASLKTPSEVASFLPLPVVESPLPCPSALRSLSKSPTCTGFLAQMDQCQLLDEPTLRHPPPPSVSLKLALFTSLNRFHFPLSCSFSNSVPSWGVSSLQMMCSIQGIPRF